jgi:hypothetical protein
MISKLTNTKIIIKCNTILVHTLNNIVEVINLIHEGADINYGFGLPIEYAIESNNFELAKVLIDMGAEIYICQFLRTAYVSNEFFELLLNEGIRYDIDTELIEMCLTNDNDQILALLIRYDIIKIIPNQQIYLYATNEFLSIMDACLRFKAKKILEFFIHNYSEIIPSTINKSLFKRKDIKKHNFIKMLINRNIIDIAD